MAWHIGVSLALLLASGCGHSSSPAMRDGAHAWDARRASTSIHITDQPGAVIDATAPPPPPGTAPARSTFMSATCSGDAVGCSEAGQHLRASHSLSEFLERLADADFVVAESGTH